VSLNRVNSGVKAGDAAFTKSVSLGGKSLNDPGQMRVLFAGRDNPFNRGIASWLAQRYDLIACYFLEPDRFSVKEIIKFIRNRIRRNGILQTMDELAFQVVDRSFIRRSEKALWEKNIPVEFREAKTLDAPCYIVKSLHSERWLQFTRQLRPDIIFSTCGRVIFRHEFYDIPRFGTFVLHEGITPEYKGLHTPLWAMLRNELEFVGVSLLRVNGSIDGGDILIQERCVVEEDEDFRCWSYVGHKAIISGLPEVELALNRLFENGQFEPIPIESRQGKYFTWMRLTAFLKLLAANKKDRTAVIR